MELLEDNHHDFYYVINKHGIKPWYLYSVEQCSFGKKILWTQNIKESLLFSSEKAVETFKSKDLQNVDVNIYRVMKDNLDFFQ